ncbi:MAG: response regulator transcription factor, partial [Lysinibacillus sp.]
NEMYTAINQVMSGKNYYDVGLPQDQLEKLFTQKRTKNNDILSKREQEIVRLIILGYTNQEIANQLYISVKTVENHKSNIMQKLELKSKADLVQFGITNGYLKNT